MSRTILVAVMTSIVVSQMRCWAWEGFVTRWNRTAVSYVCAASGDKCTGMVYSCTSIDSTLLE